MINNQQERKKLILNIRIQKCNKSVPYRTYGKKYILQLKCEE